ncbi:methyltransferase domain-containing protein [Lacihabitans lacunae]|uniref:Methyltransferase domain-containing protein n=1 Tax=Lacihabitans lacunae TaxID=1028214 RepID=A0ABV7YZ39_9BACT
MAEQLDDNFWSNRYLNNSTGWDLGAISTPIKEYVDQLKSKELSILIPGCGNAYEAEYLLAAGFKKVTLIDISEVLVKNLKEKFSAEIEVGKCEVIHGDFFKLEGQFDLVIEQTFFCAINPSLRPQYASKMAEILAPNGKIAGLLFEMEKPEGPPFGGHTQEYLGYFEPYFNIKTITPCYNSIKPRAGTELFIILEKK